MSKLQIGTIIECRDKEDMFATDENCEKAGYRTEYVYEVAGVKGCFLEVIDNSEVPE